MNNTELMNLILAMDGVTERMSVANNYVMYPLSVAVNLCSMVFYLASKRLNACTLKFYLVSICAVQIVLSIQSMLISVAAVSEKTTFLCKASYFVLEAATTLIAWFTLALVVNQFLLLHFETTTNATPCSLSRLNSRPVAHLIVIAGCVMLSGLVNIITPLAVALYGEAGCVFSTRTYLFFIIESLITISCNFLLPAASLLVLLKRFCSQREYLQAQAAKYDFTRTLLLYSSFFYASFSVTVAFTILNLYYCFKYYPGIILHTPYEATFDSEFNTVSYTLLCVYLVLFNPILILLIVKKHANFKLSASRTTRDDVILDVLDLKNRRQY